MFPSNFTKKGFLYWELDTTDLSFFKKIIHDYIFPYVLITLNNQFIFYETNLAQWNEQHPVSQSKFAKQSFYIWVFFKNSFVRTLSTMCLINPESLTQIGSAILEIIDFEQLDLPTPWKTLTLLVVR